MHVCQWCLPLTWVNYLQVSDTAQYSTTYSGCLISCQLRLAKSRETACWSEKQLARELKWLDGLPVSDPMNHHVTVLSVLSTLVVLSAHVFPLWKLKWNDWSYPQIYSRMFCTQHAVHCILLITYTDLWLCFIDQLNNRKLLIVSVIIVQHHTLRRHFLRQDIYIMTLHVHNELMFYNKLC